MAVVKNRQEKYEKNESIVKHVLVSFIKSFLQVLFAKEKSKS